MDYTRILEAARERQKFREREWKEYVTQHMDYLGKTHQWMIENSHKFLPATKANYEAWLKGALDLGKEITHSFDYSWSRWEWRLLVEDISMIPLYGNVSFEIIVQPGVKVLKEWGHCNIFFLEDFSNQGIIPIFSDTVVV